MMLKYFIVMLGLTTSVVSCTNAQQPAPAAQAAAPKQFGAPTTKDGAITYDALVAQMTSVDSTGAKVTGKVSSVCKKKGCWMTMISDKPGAPEMRVTFKDYAFFMPFDIVGKTVVIDGFALVETTPVEDLRHYAQDAGKSKEEIAKITDPLREMAFEAKGVLILD